ncbi:catabolite control protein A [Nicoliella spurrieriana]|uniref:Catabolite control protein A n=1 Tax=Nicoliella spurrieriana TaxID=2925830 RepID=A0A976X5J4_9LACO|nr:catabolite control protein A [Nicoliella spurrieriana]UQS86776.1 catabolite control protein A [Nicoliella spurrieriana]
MEKQTVTIYDVAREAHVSMATVSRVVNGNSNVRQNTRNKVLRVIKDLNYHPNAVARGLASKKTTTVGVIIPDVTNIYFSELARGINDIAEMYKYNIILASSDGNTEKECRVFNSLLAKQVDGIVFMGRDVTTNLRKAFNDAKVPVVLAGTTSKDPVEPSVNIDYRAATDEAVSQLLNNGCQKVGLVCGALKYSINREYRLAGYRDALLKKQVEFDEHLLFETSESYQDGYDLAPRLIQNGIQGAFVSDDELAAGILNGLTDASVNVPTAFQLITGNNTKFTRVVRPELSSIDQPLYDIGAVAMRLLTKLMDHDVVANKNVVLAHQIINRNSTN